MRLSAVSAPVIELATAACWAVDTMNFNFNDLTQGLGMVLSSDDFYNLYVYGLRGAESSLLHNSHGAHVVECCYNYTHSIHFWRRVPHISPPLPIHSCTSAYHHIETRRHPGECVFTSAVFGPLRGRRRRAWQCSGLERRHVEDPQLPAVSPASAAFARGAFIVGTRYAERIISGANVLSARLLARAFHLSLLETGSVP